MTFGTLFGDIMVTSSPTTPGLLGEVDVLRVQMEGTVAGGNEREVGVAIQRLQRCMLAVRELGNLKMEVSSQLVDTVSERYYYVFANFMCNVSCDRRRYSHVCVHCVCVCHANYNLHMYHVVCTHILVSRVQ